MPLRPRLLRLFLSLASIVTLTSCASPGYYYQAVSGHLSLMRSREDVAALVASPETDPSLAQRLTTAEEVLQFAASELALPAGDSYRTYAETGREAVVWNIVAAPEFSLQAKRWCFMVAGCVPYRGYFDESKARQVAASLRKKGLDVSVSAVRAYSTLGWFKDPILDTMLAYGDARLGAVLIHELAHQKTYVKGDTAFNEAYARFVEREGVRAWLLARGEEALLEEWQRLNQASDQFSALLKTTRTQLSDLYASGQSAADMRPAKQVIITGLSTDYRLMVKGDWQGKSFFEPWFESTPNNADLALFTSYQGGHCAFETLFLQADGDFREFHRRAEARSGRDSAARTAWLATEC